MTEQTSLTVGDPLPKSLGACVDALKEVTLLRLAMSKEVDAVKARERKLSEYLIDNLSGDNTGVAGLKYRAQVKKKTKYSVKDWTKVHDYVYDNDRFDLLAKSLNQKAAEEIYEAGEKLPGVDKVHVPTLSVTKI